jgi:hypothetical protein
MAAPVKAWKVDAKRSPGLAYEVRLYADGTFSCNCPGWVFGPKPRTCAHVRTIEAEAARCQST